MLLNERIKANEINMIFIILTDDESDYEPVMKYLKFISEDSYSPKSSGPPNHMDNFSREIFLVNPTPKAVSEIVRSISNVNLTTENLIFERFE